MTRSIWGDDLAVLGVPPVRRRRRFPGKGVLAAALLLAGAGFGLHYYGSSTPEPFWGVQHLEVRGNRAIPEAELLAALDLRTGMPWWSALAKLGDRAAADLPRLSRARVSFAPPAGLCVDAWERGAVLLLTTDGSLGLAEDGTVLARAPGFDRIDLPYLTGRLPAYTEGTRLDLAGAGDWWSQLAHVQTQLPELWESISQIDYQGARDFRVFLRDHTILLWDSRRNAHLWDQVPLVLSRLRVEALAGDAVLDMRFRDRIVVHVPSEKLVEEEPPLEEGDLREGTDDTETTPEHAMGAGVRTDRATALAVNAGAGPGPARSLRGGR